MSLHIITCINATVIDYEGDDGFLLYKGEDTMKLVERNGP
jgi:hypothetical protein